MRIITFIIFGLFSFNGIYGENVCYKDKCHVSSTRYLLYDVNPPEGFNLRRDVYMRIAILAHQLQKSTRLGLNSIKVVLPPWSHLIHWSYSEIPEYVPWSTFFDLHSLQLFAPVIEMHDFFSILQQNKYTKAIIDNVYILQHFDDMFETGKFVDKLEIQKCQNPPKVRYFYYNNMTSTNVKCLSFHGPASQLIQLLQNTSSKTILVDHAEVMLHDRFGDKTYWMARRSMRFNKELRKIALKFRENYLNSTDRGDNTFLEADWRNDKPKRDATGGPYIGVHLRRRDFARSRPEEVPSIENVADQISALLQKLQLEKVFIATDATKLEYDGLRSKLEQKYEVYRYEPTDVIKEKFNEGGVAIIDQIICSYSRYFLGTKDSTFSYRIQEEREILGFPTDRTFNVLCKNMHECSEPSVWKIVY
ncbi:GDP-fucose protein O-fucosyltransferase 2 [Cylas formicarius]|uniref:GDP-fucose protein O-fucosyltransferase 2 n=1 Tax=Cylas formicarius TaxID=197179 RepID=UPI002958C52E|nr:GDP-fucose protein O-fucosyltransferase 2 [Cylas formicarius]